MTEQHDDRPVPEGAEPFGTAGPPEDEVDLGAVADPQGPNADADLGQVAADDVSDGGTSASDAADLSTVDDDVVEGEIVEPTTSAQAEAEALLAEALDADSIEAQFLEAEEHAQAAGGSVAAERIVALTSDLQRVHAEYSNYRKRVERDREVVRQRAVEDALRELLPVLDNINRARQHDELVGAFRAVGEALEAVVAKLGLMPFGVVGEPFDPTRHEALMRQVVDGVTEPTVVALFEAGYTMNGRIVRAAKVAVAGTD